MPIPAWRQKQIDDAEFAREQRAVERMGDLFGLEDSAGYPVGWPRCRRCGAPVLDGHLTCGSVTCSETEERDRR